MARVFRVDLDYLATGTFSLVDKKPNELAPASVGDSASKSAVLDHPLNVQVLHSNCSESICQITRNLVMHILPSVSDFCMQARNALFNLLSPVTAFLAPRQLALSPSKLCESAFQEPCIAVDLPFGVDHEMRKPKVDSSRSTISGGTGIWKFDSESDEPFPVLTNDRSRFELRFGRNIPVPTHSDRSDVLKAQLPIDDLRSTPVSGHHVGERIESVRTLESRVSRFRALFTPAIEALKRSI